MIHDTSLKSILTITPDKLYNRPKWRIKQGCLLTAVPFHTVPDVLSRQCVKKNHYRYYKEIKLPLRHDVTVYLGNRRIIIQETPIKIHKLILSYTSTTTCCIEDDGPFTKLQQQKYLIMNLRRNTSYGEKKTANFKAVLQSTVINALPTSVF